MTGGVEENAPHRWLWLVAGLPPTQGDGTRHRVVQLTHRDVEVHLLSLTAFGPGGWDVIVDAHHGQTLHASEIAMTPPSGLSNSWCVPAE
jgi:hypothetical protein